MKKFFWGIIFLYFLGYLCSPSVNANNSPSSTPASINTIPNYYAMLVSADPTQCCKLLVEGLFLKDSPYTRSSSHDDFELAIMSVDQQNQLLKKAGVLAILRHYLQNGDGEQKYNAYTFIRSITKTKFIDLDVGTQNFEAQNLLISDQDIVSRIAPRFSPLVQGNPQNQSYIIRSPTAINALTETLKSEAMVELATLVGQNFLGSSWESFGLETKMGPLNKEVQNIIVNSPKLFGIIKRSMKDPMLVPHPNSEQLNAWLMGTHLLGLLVYQNTENQNKIFNSPQIISTLIQLLSYKNQHLIDVWSEVLIDRSLNTLYFLMADHLEIRQKMYMRYPTLKPSLIALSKKKTHQQADRNFMIKALL